MSILLVLAKQFLVESALSLLVLAGSGAKAKAAGNRVNVTDVRIALLRLGAGRVTGSFLFALALLAGAASQASAGVLVAPTFYTDAGGPYNAAGTYSYGPEGDGGFVGSVMSDAPALAYSTVSSPSNLFDLETQSLVTYQFEVLGGVTETVPLLISYNLLTGGTGPDFGALAYLYFGSNLVVACTADGVQSTVCATEGAVGSNVSSGVSDFSVTSNSVFTVRLNTSVNALSGSAYALADPEIAIDPTFADASLFTVDLSPGVGNSLGPDSPPSSVPEPASLTLLLSTVAALGAMSRRKGSLAAGRMSEGADGEY